MRYISQISKKKDDDYIKRIGADDSFEDSTHVFNFEYDPAGKKTDTFERNTFRTLN